MFAPITPRSQAAVSVVVLMIRGRGWPSTPWMFAVFRVESFVDTM